MVIEMEKKNCHCLNKSESKVIFLEAAVCDDKTDLYIEDSLLYILMIRCIEKGCVQTL